MAASDELITTNYRVLVQSINQSFILTRYVKELKNSFKIRTCINKIYNKKPGDKNIKHKKLKPTKKLHTKNVTRKTIIIVLKTVKSYNRAL